MRQIKTIVYFVWSPFTARDYQRFGIDEFRDRFEVFVFDCTSWLAPPEIGEREIPIAWFPKYCKISSLQDFDREMTRLPLDRRCAAFDILGTCRGSFEVRRRLKRAGCPRIKIDLGRLPTSTRSLRDWCSHLWSVRGRLPVMIAAKLRSRLAGPPEIVVVGGRLAENAARAKVHKVIKGHSLDYEIYLHQLPAQIDGSPARSRQHIVYLDEDFAFHQDYAHLGVPFTTTPERFFPALDRLFAHLECQFRLPVVIAAHPRSRYDKHDDVFAGRKVAKGQTPELVRDSILVVAHSSTALSFAVLFGRPVVLLTSDDIDNDTSQIPFIRAFAEKLGSPMINIDHFETLERTSDQLLVIDDKCYAEFRDNYLKARDSDDIPLWTLVGNELASYSRDRS